MPGEGRRWRRGQGPGRGGGPRRVARFIEPALLLLLREQPQHGYTLVEELRRFGFQPELLDPSIVYRALRELEQGGWALSEWDTAGSGPPRRIYRLTGEGEDHLRWWADDLRRTRAEIDHFLQLYAGGEAGT